MSLVVRKWSAGQKREVAAQAGTVLAGLLILVLVQNVVMSQEVPVREKTISISLIDPPPEPKIEPPKPKVEPPVPKKIVQPPKVITPVVATPSPVKSEVVVPVTPVTPVEPAPRVEPAPVQPPPVRRVSNGLAEGEFTHGCACAHRAEKNISRIRRVIWV